MIDNSDKLIKSEIKGRKVTYYLTTEEDLQNVKSNSFISNIFLVIASFFAGGIISVFLTKATGIQLGQDTINVLDILLYVFIFGTVIFGCFTAFFHIKSFKTISQIKGSGVVKSVTIVNQEETIDVEKAEKGIEQKESRLEILKAEYWTPKKRLDITEELRKMIINNKLETIASNRIKGDPDHGTVKRLSIKYKLDGIKITKEYKEKDKVIIP